MDAKNARYELNGPYKPVSDELVEKIDRYYDTLDSFGNFKKNITTLTSNHQEIFAALPSEEGEEKDKMRTVKRLAKDQITNANWEGSRLWYTIDSQEDINRTLTKFEKDFSIGNDLRQLLTERKQEQDRREAKIQAFVNDEELHTFIEAYLALEEHTRFINRLERTLRDKTPDKRDLVSEENIELYEKLCEHAKTYNDLYDVIAERYDIENPIDMINWGDSKPEYYKHLRSIDRNAYRAMKKPSAARHTPVDLKAWNARIRAGE